MTGHRRTFEVGPPPTAGAAAQPSGDPGPSPFEPAPVAFGPLLALCPAAPAAQPRLRSKQFGTSPTRYDDRASSLTPAAAYSSIRSAMAASPPQTTMQPRRPST